MVTNKVGTESCIVCNHVIYLSAQMFLTFPGKNITICTRTIQAGKIENRRLMGMAMYSYVFICHLNLKQPKLK